MPRDDLPGYHAVPDPDPDPGWTVGTPEGGTYRLYRPGPNRWNADWSPAPGVPRSGTAGPTPADALRLLPTTVDATRAGTALLNAATSHTAGVRPGVVELTVRVDPATAVYLPAVTAGAFVHEGRFVTPGHVAAAADAEIAAWPADGGTLHWCPTAADWLLLDAYERSQGHQTMLALDEEAAEPGDADVFIQTPYVVWSSRPYPAGPSRGQWDPEHPEGEPDSDQGITFVGQVPPA